MFAFGTLLWELITRQVPYDGVFPEDIKDRVLKQESLRIPMGIDKRVQNLIFECRLVDEKARPSFDSILEILSSLI